MTILQRIAVAIEREKPPKSERQRQQRLTSPMIARMLGSLLDGGSGAQLNPAT